MTPDGQFRVDEEIVNGCGKIMLLDRMLPALIKEGHKVWWVWWMWAGVWCGVVCVGWSVVCVVWCVWAGVWCGVCGLECSVVCVGWSVVKVLCVLFWEKV